MRGFLKFFAFLSFIGECVSALGTVYPQWESAYTKYKERKEALKTPEEREAEAQAAAEAQQKAAGTWTVHTHVPNPENTTVDAEFVEVRPAGERKVS